MNDPAARVFSKAKNVKGWCPGAWSPMRSGDGLIVRIRPRMARLSPAQAIGLAELAQVHGSGIIELTRRGNLQIRGVSEQGHALVLEGLAALGLLDATPELERRRNILVTPFSTPGDVSERIALALEAQLPDLPPLPAKFGFVVDCGDAPALASDPGDIRVEAAPRGFLVRADGSGGTPADAIPEHAVPDAVKALACWFDAAHNPHERRMAPVIARLHGKVPAPTTTRTPGPTSRGPMAGVAFGQLEAATLTQVARVSDSLRITPWRMLILEGAHDVPPPLIASADPLLGLDACPGAPLCAQATVQTRGLARQIAGRAGSIHVSGCAKGCARSAAADITLVGRDGLFDLVKHGRAGDTPHARGIAPEDVFDAL